MGQHFRLVYGSLLAIRRVCRAEEAGSRRELAARVRCLSVANGRVRAACSALNATLAAAGSGATSA
eukprot:7166390-Lingulodinium_polyedra.AAC.1